MAARWPAVKVKLWATRVSLPGLPMTCSAVVRSATVKVVPVALVLVMAMLPVTEVCVRSSVAAAVCSFSLLLPEMAEKCDRLLESTSTVTLLELYS